MFASWTRQLLGYGVDLRTFWNPGRPYRSRLCLSTDTKYPKVDPNRSRTWVLRILSQTPYQLGHRDFEKPVITGTAIVF